MKNLKIIKLINKIRLPLWRLYDDNQSGDLDTYSDEVRKNEYKAQYGEDLVRVIRLMEKIEHLFLSKSVNKQFFKKIGLSDVEFYESFFILYKHLIFESKEKLAQFLNLFFELNLDFKNGRIDTRNLIPKLEKNKTIKSFGLDENFNFYKETPEKEISETAKEITKRNKDFHDFYYSGYDSDLMMTKIFERLEAKTSLPNEISVSIKRDFNDKWKEKIYQKINKINKEIIKNLNDVAEKLEKAVKQGIVKINDFGFSE
jgi:hypothetical protein